MVNNMNKYEVLKVTSSSLFLDLQFFIYTCSTFPFILISFNLTFWKIRNISADFFFFLLIDLFQFYLIFIHLSWMSINITNFITYLS